MEKTESYLSKDYLLLTSRSNKNKTIKSEDAVVQEKEELRTLPDPQPVQMPTTIAADMGTMPRIVDKLDKGNSHANYISLLISVSAVH
jgi:hypothetical protein